MGTGGSDNPPIDPAKFPIQNYAPWHRSISVTSGEAETVVRESAYRGNHTVADRQCQQPLRVTALRIPSELPVVQHQIALWQIVNLPCFHSAAIPVDLRVTKRDSRSARL